jgi:hypothetical protein
MQELVQCLSKIPELRGRPAADLEPAIRDWFQKSAKNTESFWPEVWQHWVYLWDTWVNKSYRDAAYQAYDAAMAKPLPAAAMRYPDEALQRLVALCHEMELRSGLKVWHLSCRKAGDVLGIGKNKANEFLNQLVSDGVLERTEEHIEGSPRAQRYRYVAGEVKAA